MTESTKIILDDPWCPFDKMLWRTVSDKILDTIKVIGNISKVKDLCVSNTIANILKSHFTFIFHTNLTSSMVYGLNLCLNGNYAPNEFSVNTANNAHHVFI